MLMSFLSKWVGATLVLVALILPQVAMANGAGLTDCGDALISRPPDFSPFTENAFVSVRAAERKVYERYGNLDGTVTGIRWWGITTSVPGSSNCTIDTPSFEVSFSEDNLAVPGGTLESFTVTPTITDTGQNLFGVPVKLFEATFPSPVELSGSGWVGVFDPSFSQTCRFSWVASEVGGGQAVAFNYSNLSWIDLNDDVSFCLLGTPSGEGEGEPEPSLNCYGESLFGQSPDLGPFGTGHFSARSTNRKLYERVEGVNEPVAALRWWGIASQAPSGSACDLSATPLEISFSMDGGALPGGGIATYTLTPSITPTGQLVAGSPLLIFEAILPETVSFDGGSGWVGIYDPNFSNTCRFGWASSLDGNGQAARFRSDLLTWEDVNDDLALCLLPEGVILPPEGEGEGVPEGILEGEGGVEGEPGELTGCGDGSFLSSPPDFSVFSANAYASVRASDRKVYQRYGYADGTVTGIRWWGISTTVPAGSDCSIAPASFEVAFHSDNLSVPGGTIESVTVTPTITDTGETLFGVPVKLFEATFQSPIALPNPGWLSVYDPSAVQSCRFSWLASEIGGGQAVAFNYDNLTWINLYDDVAYCLIGEGGPAEGEGEPSIEVECSEDSVFGQTPDLGPFGTGHFSVRSSSRKLYERVTGVDDEIVAVRWWGLSSQAPSGTYCNLEGTPMEVSFSLDNGSFPGGGIVDFTVTPTITDTGIEVANLPLLRFDVELPESVTLEGGTGWVSIFDPSFSSTCRFGWASSIEGNGQARRFRYDTLTWENVNDDLALCLIAEPGAEGEGAVDGEGAVEGEGTIDGEGTAEGEGTSEGEGANDGEGNVDGEGSSEGEGEVLPDCTFPLSGDQEVGPVSTNAVGIGYFTTDNDGNLTGLYVEHDVANPTMAHIHTGAAGVNGGVIIDLGNPTSPIIVSFTVEQVALLHSTPAFYVNVHSTNFGGGEIRGQAEQCLPEELEGEGTNEGEVPVVDPNAYPALEGFRDADSNQDGRLSEDEATVGLQLGLTDIEALDLNGDGFLTIAEIQRLTGGNSPIHNADQDGDGSIALGELLRVIQLYNAGGYDCTEDPDATEDGFEIAVAKELSPSCLPHASDYQGTPDGLISLSELLRLIQLYNLQAIVPCVQSEDGFCLAP